jgi:hypothetical protein
LSHVVKLTLFKPLPPQVQISEQAERFNVIVTGRRVGKSESTWSVRRAEGRVHLPLILPAVKEGFPVAIFAKEFKDLELIWNGICVKYEGLIAKKDSTSHSIKFHGGGTLDLFSLANVGRKESGRGRKFKRVIVEEAQKIDDEILRYWWNNVVRATLMDMQGDAFIIANPNGQGTYLHELARRGADGTQADLPLLPKKFKGWKTFRFATSDNPLIDPQEIADAADELDALSYQQEIEGLFVNYAGAIWCYAAKEPEVQARVFKTGLRVNKTLPLVISFDFNKRPMTAVAMQFPPLSNANAQEAARISALIRCGVKAIQEFCTEIETDASIYDTCRLVREWVYSVWGVKIGNWPEGNFICTLPIFVTGDASGNTSDGRQVDPMTYYDIICSELGMIQVNNVRILSSNPPHADSYVKINSNFRNNPDLEIDREGCPKLIQDIFAVKSDKFRGIDKSDMFRSHLLDCFRYGIHNFA